MAQILQPSSLGHGQTGMEPSLFGLATESPRLFGVLLHHVADSMNWRSFSLVLPY